MEVDMLFSSELDCLYVLWLILVVKKKIIYMFYIEKKSNLERTKFLLTW